jgi:hypothetical protein
MSDLLGVWNEKVDFGMRFFWVNNADVEATPPRPPGSSNSIDRKTSSGDRCFLDDWIIIMSAVRGNLHLVCSDIRDGFPTKDGNEVPEVVIAGDGEMVV